MVIHSATYRKERITLSSVLVSLSVALSFLQALSFFSISALFGNNMLLYLYIPVLFIAFIQNRGKIGIKLPKWFFTVILYLSFVLIRAVTYKITYFIQAISGLVLFISVLYSIKNQRQLSFFCNILTILLCLLMIISFMNIVGVITIDTYRENSSLFKDYSAFAVVCLMGVSFAKCRKRPNKIVVYVVFALAIFLILLSESRKILFMIPWVFFYLFYWKKNKSKKFFFLYFSITFILGIVLLLSMETDILYKYLPDRVASFIIGEDATGEYIKRFDVASIFLNYFIYNFTELELFFGKGAFASNVVFSNNVFYNNMNAPHNYLIASLFDGGFAGLLIMLYFTFNLAKDIISQLIRPLHLNSTMNIFVFMGPILIFMYLISGAHIIYSSYFWIVTAVYLCGKRVELANKE